MADERRKVRVGRVLSDKMDKTVIVAVEWLQHHPKYGKSVKRVTRLVAHDAANACRVGDMVRVVETRPLSKTKRWRVREVLSHQELLSMQAETAGEQEVPAVAADAPATVTPMAAAEAAPPEMAQEEKPE